MSGADMHKKYSSVAFPGIETFLSFVPDIERQSHPWGDVVTFTKTIPHPLTAVFFKEGVSPEDINGRFPSDAYKSQDFTTFLSYNPKAFEFVDWVVNPPSFLSLDNFKSRDKISWNRVLNNTGYNPDPATWFDLSPTSVYPKRSDRGRNVVYVLPLFIHPTFMGTTHEVKKSNFLPIPGTFYTLYYPGDDLYHMLPIVKYNLTRLVVRGFPDPVDDASFFGVSLGNDLIVDPTYYTRYGEDPPPILIRTIEDNPDSIKLSLITSLETPTSYRLIGKIRKFFSLAFPV